MRFTHTTRLGQQFCHNNIGLTMECVAWQTHCSSFSVCLQSTNRWVVTARHRKRKTECLVNTLRILFTNIWKTKKALSFLHWLKNNIEKYGTFNNMRILAPKEVDVKKYAVKFSSHCWVTHCKVKRLGRVLVFLTLTKLSLLLPESKLEKEWAVWLERPWADSKASVFGCTWQVKFVVS